MEVLWLVIKLIVNFLFIILVLKTRMTRFKLISLFLLILINGLTWEITFNDYDDIKDYDIVDCSYIEDAKLEIVWNEKVEVLDLEQSNISYVPHHTLGSVYESGLLKMLTIKFYGLELFDLEVGQRFEYRYYLNQHLEEILEARGDEM